MVFSYKNLLNQKNWSGDIWKKWGVSPQMPGGPVMDEDGLAVQSTGEATPLGFMSEFWVVEG